MTQIIQIKRTTIFDHVPTGLAPGELAVEMGTPTRLWVGVPAAIDPLQKKLLIDLGTSGDSITQAEADLRYVNISGDAMNGILDINAAQAFLRLDGTAGAGIGFEQTNVPRWTVNGLTNFSVQRFNDSGVAIGDSITISRATGAISLNGNTNVVGSFGASTISSAGTITAAGLSTFTGIVNNGTLVNNDDVTIQKATTRLTLNKNVGGQNLLQAQAGGTMRWIIELGDGTAESGANAGSNFGIYCYNDAGGYIGTPIGIVRASGLVTIPTLNSTNLNVTNLGVTTLSVFGGSTLSGLTNTGTFSNTGAINSTGNITSGGELKAAATVRLSSDNSRYLHWDGTNYSLGGAGTIWHSGNLNPAAFQPAGNYVPRSGGVVMSGPLYFGSTSYYFTTDGSINATNITSNGNTTVSGTMQSGAVVTWGITNYGHSSLSNVSCASFSASGHVTTPAVNLDYPGVYFNGNTEVRMNWNGGEGGFYFSHTLMPPKIRANSPPSAGYIIGSKGFDDTTGLWQGYNAGNGVTSVIRAGGGFESSINSYGGISDTRLKRNIADPSPKLAKVMQVPVKTYTMELPDGGVDPDMQMIGVPSDALAKIFPSLVERADDGYDRVKYSVLNGPILLKAFQEYVTESSARIAALEAKIEQLITQRS